jgi:hypothetical protein
MKYGGRDRQLSEIELSPSQKFLACSAYTGWFKFSVKSTVHRGHEKFLITNCIHKKVSK